MSAKISVVGSIAFNTGIGKHTIALCEILSRITEVSLIPIEQYKHSSIDLPTGKKIRICRNVEEVEICFYGAVLWNNRWDFNVNRIPEKALKFALIAFDSDRMPARWVTILNEKFDAVFCVNKNLEIFVKNSGVKIPIGTMPLALDFSQWLAASKKVANLSSGITFCSVGAFHPRKENQKLIVAFAKLCSKYENIRLVIHSNLDFNGEYGRCIELTKSLGIEDKVLLSNSNKNQWDVFRLINDSDIYVNLSRGEGFSIGIREALAAGKTIVYSDVPPHRDFNGLPGAFSVNCSIPIPAMYPEIEGICSGFQYSVSEESLTKSLEDAIEYSCHNNSRDDFLTRKVFASKWSFANLLPAYLKVICPDAYYFNYRNINECDALWNIPSQVERIVRAKVGDFSIRLGKLPKKKLIAAHDGGFFSIFNVYMSHLVWARFDPSVSAVIPDWDVKRFLERNKGQKPMSFCYAQEEDGNFFTKLFQPLPGISHEKLNDPEWLYTGATVISNNCAEYFNGIREPLLTYKSAADLYQSSDFTHFRVRYNKVFNEFIALTPDLQQEIDTFCQQFENSFVIAAHVRHPSHAIEQKNNTMPTPEDYIKKIRKLISERGVNRYKIFLATDQDSTIRLFRKEFGSDVCFYKNVRRLTDEEDSDFYSLPENKRAVEGFQLQHKVARDQGNWNLDMAREVIRDAWTMARSNVLLHVTSNVSTAVSYINPETEFITIHRGES